jgi:hypothetical protein
LVGASLNLAMVCKALSGERTVRHHMLTNAWRRVCSRAGVATSLEPHLDRLDRTVRCPGWRGDLLLAPAAGLQVADVSVTHPAAATYVTGAARTPGSAAVCRDARKCRQYAKDSDGLQYALVPLTSETFGRLGGPAMDHLSAMADLAVSGATPGADVSHGRFIASQAVTFGLESPCLRGCCSRLSAAAFVLLPARFCAVVLPLTFLFLFWDGCTFGEGALQTGGQSGRTANRRSRGPRPGRGRKASTKAQPARPTVTQTAQQRVGALQAGAKAAERPTGAAEGRGPGARQARGHNQPGPREHRLPKKRKMTGSERGQRNTTEQMGASDSR